MNRLILYVIILIVSHQDTNYPDMSLFLSFFFMFLFWVDSIFLHWLLHWKCFQHLWQAVLLPYLYHTSAMILKCINHFFLEYEFIIRVDLHQCAWAHVLCDGCFMCITFVICLKQYTVYWQWTCIYVSQLIPAISILVHTVGVEYYTAHARCYRTLKRSICNEYKNEWCPG